MLIACIFLTFCINIRLYCDDARLNWVYHKLSNLSAPRDISGPAEVEYKVDKYDFNFFYNVYFHCNIFSKMQCNAVIFGQMCQIVEKGSWQRRHKKWLSHFMLRIPDQCYMTEIIFYGWHHFTFLSKGYKCGSIQSFWGKDEDRGGTYLNFEKFETKSFPRILVGAGVLCSKKKFQFCIPYMYRSFDVLNITENKIEYHEVRKTLRVVFHKVTMQLIFEYRATCKLDYYFRYCWYRCSTTKKQVCDNKGVKQCRGHWGFVAVNYQMANTPDVTKFECIFYDMCSDQSNLCSNSKNMYCFPVKNGTAVCSNTIPIYVSSTELTSYNISDSLFVIGEATRCILDVHPDISNRTKVYFDLIPEERKQHVHFFSQDNILTPLTTISEGMVFSINCQVEFMERWILRSFRQNISIAKKAEEVILFNVSMGFGKSIYVGQSFNCTTDGWPVKYFIFTIDLPTKNFATSTYYKVPGEKVKPITVPTKAYLGFCIIRCNVTNDFKNGRVVTKHSKDFDYGLKSYVYFGWTPPHKNVYLFGEYLDCSFQAFIEGEIMLRQFRGMIKIKNQQQSYFYLNMPFGGDYGFFCILEFPSTNYIYSKRLEFEFFQQPRDLCFQLFPFMRGALIQCNSNTYPHDLADTTIAIAEMTNDEVVASSSGQPYIRIPYDFPSKKAFVKCTITYTYLGVTSSASINKSITVRKVFKDQISHDKTTLHCLNYHSIMEPEDMYYIGKGIFEFYKPSFMLSTEDIDAKFEFPQIAGLVLPLMALLIFFMALNTTLLSSADHLLSKQIGFYNLSTTFRRLNDMLNMVATRLTSPRSAESERRIKEVQNLFQQRDQSLFGSTFLRQSRMEQNNIRSHKTRASAIDSNKTQTTKTSVKTSTRPKSVANPIPEVDENNML